MIMQLCEYTSNQQTAQFKRVNFVVCELYLDKAIFYEKLKRKMDQRPKYKSEVKTIKLLQKNMRI